MLGLKGRLVRLKILRFEKAKLCSSLMKLKGAQIVRVTCMRFDLHIVHTYLHGKLFVTLAFHGDLETF